MTDAGEFRIEEAFSSLLPAARIGTVVARGVDNRRGAEEARRRLTAAAAETAAGLADGEIGAHPAVAP